MSELEAVSYQADVADINAQVDIAKAVGVRHSLARRYVLGLRRQHSNSTPSEVVAQLERHYLAVVSGAGAAVAAVGVAANLGLALIPVPGGAAAPVAKQGAKAAVKSAAFGAARLGGPHLVKLLPAGDAQLQFEITAMFALAVADIHSLVLDRDQAHTLVYGLTNGRVSQQLIARMAYDLAAVDVEDTSRTDSAHWVNTLAKALPNENAGALLRTIQTGRLDDARRRLNGSQQAAVDYGAGALVGGLTRFVFGREVVAAAREAFAAAPEEFPEHLADIEPNRAFVAFKKSARTTGEWISDTAGMVGSRVSAAAGAVSTNTRKAAGTVTEGAEAVAAKLKRDKRIKPPATAPAPPQ